MMLLSSIMIHYNIDLFLKSTLGINLPSLATHPSLFEWLDIRPFNTLIKGSNPIHTTFNGTGRNLLIGMPSIFCEISPFAIIHTLMIIAPWTGYHHLIKYRNGTF